jgi:DNA-binding response OmpR family regulator
MKSVMTGRNILLVDDEPDIAMVFKTALQDAGFIVQTYQDPIVALAEFTPCYYDLIILDVKMPKMNGFELYTKMLKADSQIKCCFITAGEMYYDEIRSGQPEIQEKYCKLDTERFFQKPISNIDLVNRIKRIMRQDKNLELPQQKHRAYFSHKK